MSAHLFRCKALVTFSFVALLSFDSACASEGQSDAGVMLPIYERFAPIGEGKSPTDEVPDFQKHVSPLLGRLGCNGRACHGSFQGQGGFQLSLFGYDFETDHTALLEDGMGRVELKNGLESLILTKPVDADMHEGGKRFEQGGWEYWVLRKWIEAGAPFDAAKVQRLQRLEVSPRELDFSDVGQIQQLRAVAYWDDGTVEDVTSLCRFQTNDASIADIDESGRVASGEPGDTHVVVSYDNAVVPVLVLRPLSNQAGENYPQIAASTEIDRLVIEKLKKLGIVPSDICDDATFLRRASLDATGSLPSADEVVAFINDQARDKRAAKIEEMLSRPTYAAQWTTFLCDVTGNNEDQLRNFLPQQIRPENQWYQWIYQRVQSNVPYDEIVEGIVTATSRLPGESYADYCETMSEICRDGSGEKFAKRPGLVHYWARNNFRTEEDRAIGFAYSFLGVRIQCAQCHKHPFDQWSKSDFDGFEKLFGRVQANQNTLAPDAKRQFAKMVEDLGISKDLKGNNLRKELGLLLNKGEVVPLPELFVAAQRPVREKGKKIKMPVAASKAKLLGGDWIELDQDDVRGRLMEWLRSPDNPYFAKAIVNRIWTQYFGIGIVNPPDDLNLANAPSNAPLLDYLANGFVENGFDLKWVHRQILNSDTYQRSWIPNETNALDKHNFSHSQLRRLPAESTFDAVYVALADDEIGRKVRELEIDRATTLAGASARTNNRVNPDQQYALTVFGRSVRESNCDCDRSSEPSLLQTVFLVNDAAVQGWLGDSKTSWTSSVADKFGWKLAGSPQGNQMRSVQMSAMLQRFVDQKSSIEQRIADAEENGQEKMVQTLQKKKSEMLERAKSVAKKNELQTELKRALAGVSVGEQKVVASSSSRMTEEQALWIAENAYLRTLNRKPNADELAISLRFLQSDDQPTTAVEGLMWSLINTKEFILNH